ncbi:MAG: WecB/TagA/CpsF family glycosyltransferase [Microcoleaceae cyanobacterium]
MPTTTLEDESMAPSFPVLGLPVHVLSDYGSWVFQRLGQEIGTHIVTLNAEMAMQAEQNQPLADVIHQADLVIPDGSGVVLYLRFKKQQVQRCPGIELAEALIPQVAQRYGPESLCFYGAKPGITQQAAERLLSTGGESVKTFHGYLKPEEQQPLFRHLEAIQPKLILVGLGVPRQEFWIAQNRHLCPNSIWVGVGGSFDIWAGTKERAPAWFCDNHLEWLYRLYQEPWRWRRMLALPQFAWKALMSG